MDTHKNAPLTPKGREMMVRAFVDRGLSKAAAAGQFNITPKTVAKWVRRFCAEGVDGLRDRSSRPLSSPSQTTPATAATIEVLRRQRYTAKQIAAEIGVSAATVSRILRRRGLNRLSALEPAEPIRRYEREKPGELIHIDIKKLGRIGSVGHRIAGRQTGVVNRHLGIGWEFVHVCIDDASRVAFSQVMKDEKKEKRGRISQGRRRLLRKPGRENRACHDRQWFLLSIQSLREGLQNARPQAHPHQALHAQDQRQGRALHPDEPARMGLRPRLQHLRRAHRRTAQMAPPLQLASASWQYRRQDTHQPPRTNRE